MTRQPDQVTGMSGYACDVAVSEMFGIPVESMCGYLVLARVDIPDGHRNMLITGPAIKGDDGIDWEWAVATMEDVAATIREDMEDAP